MSSDTDTPIDVDSIDTATLRRHWTVVLAEYWRQTDWSEFQEQKRRSETFEERLLSAQNAGDVPSALKKLARGLGMAAPDLPTANLNPLVEHDAAAMRVLRREDVFLVAKAREAVQNYFAAKERAEDDDLTAADIDDTKPTTSTLSDFVTDDT